MRAATRAAFGLVALAAAETVVAPPANCEEQLPPEARAERSAAEGFRPAAVAGFCMAVAPVADAGFAASEVPDPDRAATIAGRDKPVAAASASVCWLIKLGLKRNKLHFKHGSKHDRAAAIQT